MAADLQDGEADNSYCIETQRRICSRHPTPAGWVGFLENLELKAVTCCHEIVQVTFAQEVNRLRQWLI
jgi:hypothetical protein